MQGRRSDAAKMFMRVVQMPALMVMLMPLMPVWPKICGVAHTLPYDARILGDTQSGKPLPRDRWRSVTMPTLVMDGGKSPAWLRNAGKALADVLPGSEHRTLPGQTHMVKAKAIAPVLAEFFGA